MAVSGKLVVDNSFSNISTSELVKAVPYLFSTISLGGVFSKTLLNRSLLFVFTVTGRILII